MGALRAVVLSAALVALLAGCPAIVGLDGDYSVGGSDDGGQTTDGPGSADGPGSGGGKDGSGKHDGNVHDTGSGGDDGPAVDGRTDSSHPGDTGPPPKDTGVPGVDACSVACALTAPAGWTLVAFEASQSTPCPSRFTETGVIEPDPSSGSCPCSDCTVITGPCESSDVTVSFGDGDCTGETDFGFPENNGQCTMDWFPPCTDFSAAAPDPEPGNCSATPTPTGPTSTPERYCTPTECAGDACEPGLGSAFTTCLYQDGDQPCPGGAPNKHAVGTSASVTCGVCDCSVGATSCSGTLTVYSTHGDCTGSVVLTVDTDSLCGGIGSAEEGDAYIWNANTIGLTCSAGTSSASVNVAGKGTICCP